MKHNAFLLSFLWLLCLILFCPGGASADTLSAQSTGVFTGKDAEVLLTAVLVKAGAGEDIQVTLTQVRDEDVLASGDGTITAETDGLELDSAHGSWQAVLLLQSGGKNLAPVKLTGRYEEMTQVPVLKTQVQAPDVIHEEDIAWDRQPAHHLRRNTITDVHDLIGKSPRHVISPGRPIRTEEVAGPSLVLKGTQVTMLYKSHNLEIKTFGEALESGAKGDVIRVRNITSKAIIQGTVESTGHVLVSSPDSDAAEAL